MIVLIEGCGSNIASVKFALQRLGHTAIISADPKIIQRASHVILPGVGTAHHAMMQLKNNGLTSVITSLTQPVLGICLGMQLLFTRSEEGDTKTLGIFPGVVKRFTAKPPLTIPHMGWSQLNTTNVDNPLSNNGYVYFVHSYAAPVNEYTVASCHYDEEFSAMVMKDNFVGMQFHPERSGEVGAQLLKNFIALG